MSKFDCIIDAHKGVHELILHDGGLPNNAWANLCYYARWYQAEMEKRANARR